MNKHCYPYTLVVIRTARKFAYPLLILLGIILAPASASADQYMVALKDSSVLSMQAVNSLPAGVKDLGQIGAASNRLIDIPHASVAAVVGQLSSSKSIKYVEPNFKIKGLGLPDDPFVQDGSQWWFTNIQTNTAWDITGSGSSITVAVIDSGLMSGHEDLSGRVWTNPNETAGNGMDDDGNGKVDDVHGWNWVDASADVADQSGHGTRVSSIIAANSNNSLGIAGVAPQAKIMPLRFLDSNNEGRISDAIEALDYARLNGAKIVNNSWGYYTVSDPESRLYGEALTRARTAGMLVVNAAGNEGYNLDTRTYYPASYPQDNNLVVSSVDSKEPLLPTWANYGVKSVDLTAPGVNIKSSDQTGSYSFSDGTSLSAPMVAGAAAWLWGLRPSATYPTIKTALIDHAVNIVSLKAKTYKGAKLDLVSSWNWMKAVPVLPVNLTVPVAAANTSNIACTPGTWQAGVISRYYYSWVLADSPATVMGSSPLVKLRDGFWGKNVVCKVTAKNRAGSSTASSAAITIPHPAPSNVAPPAIGGVLGVDRALTCAPGKWAKDPTDFSYSWTLAGQTVDGNTTNTYTVSQADQGKTLVCIVKASNYSVDDPPVLQQASSSSKGVLITWRPDSVAPAAPPVTQPRTPTALTRIPILLRGEANALFKCKIDGGAAAACGPQTAVLPEGAHTLAVTQTDLAGNVSPATTISWSIDLTSPSAPDMEAVFQPGLPPVTTGSASFTNSQTISVVFKNSETGATFQCKFDEEIYKPCTSPYKREKLTVRKHTLVIKQLDIAGNLSLPSQTLEWTIDREAPAQPTFTHMPAASSTTISDYVAFSGDGSSTFECAYDSHAESSYHPCTSPYTLTDMPVGAHYIDVRQVDAAKNKSTVKTYAWTVLNPDVTAPAPPVIVTAPSGFTNLTTLQASWTGEAGAKSECLIDDNGAGYTLCTSPLNLTGITEGAHSIKIRQTDAVGNVGSPSEATWAVDLTAPDTATLSGAPSNPTNSTTPVTIAFNSTETSPTFSYSINGGTTWSAYSSANSYAFSSQVNATSYRIKVRQKDRAGNTSADSAETTWLVDTQAPSAPTITQPTTPSNATSTTVVFTAAETGGSVECKLDAGSWGSCTSYNTTSKASTWALAGLSEGSHTVSVRQTDASGNAGTIGTTTWTVDLTSPGAPTISQLTSPSNATSTTVVFTAAETGGSVQCKLDAGSWGSCTSYNTTSKAGTWALTGLSEGAHVVSVRQTDASGNAGSADTMDWTVDLTAPNAPTLAGAPSAYKNTTTAVTITFNSTETSPTFSYSVNGGTTWTAYSSTSSYTFSSQVNASTYRIKIRQKDQAGNTSADSSEISWAVDTQAPSAPTITPLTTPTLNTNASISFTAAETGGSVQCKLDAGSWGDCDAYDSSSKAGTWALAGLSEGSHTVSVRQTDASGNTGTTATMTWVVDLTAPSSPTITPLATPTLNTSASIVLTAAETGGSVQCKLDAGSWGSCTSYNTTSKAGTWALTGLSEGSHVVSVRQTDASGNVGATATMAWLVDLTAPDAPTLVGAPAAYTNSTSAVTVTVSNPEANATLSYSLNSGSTWSAYSSTSGYTFSTQTNGSSYKIRWRQKDQAGNVGSSSTDVSWTVDTIAPSAPLLAGTPSAFTNSTTSSISISGETSATFSCSVDGGDYSTCASPKSLSGLADGSHSLAVKQVDQAGNTSATATTSSWTVDTAAPSAPVISSGPSGTSQNTAGTAAWSGETSAQFAYSTDNGSTWSSWSAAASKAYSAMTVGDYSLQVKQKDQAGNESNASSLSWTVQPPTITSFTAVTAGGTPITEGVLLSSNTANSQSVVFSYTTDATSLTATECQIDGGSWTACTAGTAVSTTLATGTQHTLNVRISTSAGTSPSSTVSWKIMPTLTFDNTRGISQDTNNGASIYNVEDPTDTQASNPTSYPVYYTSNADSNITGTPSYTCERWIGTAYKAETISSCKTGSYISTSSLQYSASNAGDMYVHIQANIGGALSNKITQQVHSNAPYPDLQVYDTSPDTYSQYFSGFSYKITNGTASSCQWRKYDTNGIMVSVAGFAYGCPNNGAGGTQTVDTSSDALPYPTCGSCWSGNNKGAAMQITALPLDKRPERSVTHATDDAVSNYYLWADPLERSNGTDGMNYNGIRWRRINASEFTRYGDSYNTPANAYNVTYPHNCYTTDGKTAYSSTFDLFSSGISLLTNAGCSGSLKKLYMESAVLQIYNWGDDLKFGTKLTAAYSISAGSSMMAKTSTYSSWDNTLIAMPYTTLLAQTTMQSSSAYKTCTMPNNGATIGSILYLHLFARNSSSGTGGAYFNAFSSTGAATGTNGSRLAASCA